MAAPATSLIYVDPVYGNDSTGTGLASAPFATIAHAASVAVSGQAIHALPGTFTEVAFTIPNGVSLIGCGVGVTKVNVASSVTGSTAFITIPNGAMVTISGMTINAVNGTNSIYPIQVATASSWSFNLSLREVDVTGYIDVLFCHNTSGSGTGTLFCENVWLRSFYDTCNFILPSGQSVSATFVNTHFIITYEPTPSGMMRCISGNNVAAYCEGGEFHLINPTGGATAPTTQLWNGFTSASGSVLTARNCRFIQDSSGVAAPYLTSWPTVSLGGNVAEYVLAGRTSILSLPNTPQTLAVSSSAISPLLAGMNEVSVDASTLTSNTLTINATPSDVTPMDQTRMIISIANTAESAAMTVAFGDGYDASNFATIPQIQAGCWAIFEFSYAVSEAQWRLEDLDILPVPTGVYGGLMA
jgi:hypothetical protein